MEDSRRANLIVLILSGTFAVLVGLDLVTDYHSGSTGAHLILEGLLLVTSGTFFVLAVKRLALAKKEITSLKVDVEKLHQEKEQWKNETHQMLAGLSVKIEEQFGKWKLTQAETEV